MSAIELPFGTNILYHLHTVFLLFIATSSAFSMDHPQNITAQSATELALVYAYPLLAYQKAFTSLSPRIGINRIGHSRQLATATNRYVVKPNVDTLYSTAIYDVSNTDVVVELPVIPEEQYALLSFSSLYGDNFAVLEKKDFDRTRKIRLSHGLKEKTTGKTADASHNSSTAVSSEDIISSPTTFGFIMVRWLVKEDNLDLIHSLQNATTVRTVSESSKSNMKISPDNPCVDAVSWTSNSTSPAEAALRLLCQIGTENRPKAISEDLTNKELLERSGVCDSGIETPGVDLEAANRVVLAHAKAAGEEATQNLNNGWSVVQSNLTGDFGIHHGLRMEISSTGYLMLKAPYAIYPSWTNGSMSRPMQGQSLELGADESYIYTFSGKPKLRELGFWSLTAYDADGFLIDNVRNVFSLGDRSNIKYRSGRPIYGSGSDPEQDEPFQLLIQPADVIPPASWIDNWLPGPSRGGSLTALLRWYNADDALVDGSYQYPVVTKQKAFRPEASHI